MHFLHLKQITYYTYANSPRSKTVMVVMVEKRTRGCATNREDIILSNMRVPAVPPSDETTSNIIKVRYFCRVRKFGFFIRYFINFFHSMFHHYR